MRRAAIAVLLAACGATPYQDALHGGGGEGYGEEQMPSGDWAIVVKVNASTDHAIAEGYAYRRARELCGGPYTDVTHHSNDPRGFDFVLVARCGEPSLAEPSR